MADPSSASPPSVVVDSENVAAEEPVPEPPPSFPPYPPFAVEPAPTTLADVILAGRDIRAYQKSGVPKKPARPPPRPARPKGPKAADVKLTKRQMRAHARCLRRHNAVLTDRLEYMSKPHRRRVICLWREHGDLLPADTIARLRTMLDANEPFKPDQAYQYFINLKRARKMNKALRINEIKKDVTAMVADRRFVWARNATVAFARGIQQRLSRPARYSLADSMLRLSNIILNEICGYMHMRPPSRRCEHPKAKFMMEMADKVAIWIEEIMNESDDRMLMMDFDEDDDVLNADEYGDSDGFTDNFLDMMGGAGGRRRRGPPAYEKLTGDMADSFKELTTEMHKKGDTLLIEHGKFKQTYSQAANYLKRAEDLEIQSTNQPLTQQLNKELTDTVGAAMSPNLAAAMPKIVDMASNTLAQHAEYNKAKGPAFDSLVKEMKAKGNETLHSKDDKKQTYAQAAKVLEEADTGLDATHDDPNLSQEINAKLAQTVGQTTSPEMQQEMKETVDIVSKFLSEKVVDEGIRVAGGVVTDPGFYVDEHGVKRPFGPNDQASDFYIDENGVRRKLKPGEQTYVDAQGNIRKAAGNMAAPLTEEGYYVDENGVKKKIDPNENPHDYYVDENGIRRKKKLGEQTYVDAQGIVRKVQPGAMAAPLTEEGFYVDENGIKQKIDPNENPNDYYVDEKGIRRKKKPGEQTYVDAQGIVRKVQPGGMAPPLTEEGFYVDENGVKQKIDPNENPNDYYVDEKGIRRKKKPGEQTYVDAQGIVRKVQPGGMAPPLTEEGFYVDENGVKQKIDPNENPNDYYVDETGIRRKKKPGEQTYVDAQGIVRKVQTGGMAPPLTEEGFYVDENGVNQKIDPNENPNDYYVDESGIRRKKKPGEHTYVDAQGIVRKLKPGAMAPPLTEEGFYVDENGVKQKIDPNENPNDYYVDEKGIRRKKKPGEETYVDAQGIVRKVKPGGPGSKAGTDADDYYIDAQGNRKKKSGAGDSFVDKDGVKRTRKGRDDAEAPDPDYAAALGLLHGELVAKGGAPLYTQPHTELTHAQASEWLKQKPRIDKAVKESGDTARLHKKFERKLGDLVAKKTPPHLQDAMQDVVIDSARILSENFVSNNYKALVKDGLISEMQKKGNEILVEVGGAPETFFQAAQRLKKASSLEAKEPCDRIERVLSRQMEDMVLKSRSMPRKVIATMKDHIKVAAEYLSEHVTKPDEQIEAYVALLNEMEARGETFLFEGDIPKSYKSCAAYLRDLTSFDDHVNRPNATLKSTTESKLQSIMANVEPHGYTPAVLSQVIGNAAGHLVSYIMLQGERTEALKVLVDKLAEAGPAVLLRHGTIRKGHGDGADVLRGKNADQLNVTHPDPVVARKIQIKLDNLMKENTPDKFQGLMPDVIEDATMYLANYLLQPRVIQVCKCMKNVFVQCELWCDEILRRVARPCCTCSRHVSAQALADLAPCGMPLRFAPGSTRAFLPGLEVDVTPCPSRSRPCLAPHPTAGCKSYMVYSASTASYQRRYSASPSRLDSSSSATGSYVAMDSSYERQRLAKQTRPDTSARSPERDVSITETVPRRDSDSDSEAVPATNGSAECEELYLRMPSSMFAVPSYSHGSPSADSCFSSASPSFFRASSAPPSASVRQKLSFPPRPSALISPTGSATRRQMSSISDFVTPAQTVSTDQMSDWHAMMVSLMWNVQAWRDWIQENINRALSYQPDRSIPTAEADEKWASFQRRVSTEALQWRQYNLFSRQLTLRLALRYRDKQIVSPTKAMNRTETYIECQREMLEIIEMFNRWTQWLSDIVKETNSLTTKRKIDLPIHELRWHNFKMKIEECSKDWEKYNLHLKVCWEQKYQTLIAEWLPAWKQPGPVWVVSACGAVPSGAVAAGLYDSEVVWVARTTHRCNVLPGALHPSKHCCIVYADGAVHLYTKYQVLCNAETTWMPWRAGGAVARAVRVAPGVHVGRVLYRGAHLVGAVHAPHYRCHVVIFGRPFAFNCYEILVLAEEK